MKRRFIAGLVALACYAVSLVALPAAAEMPQGKPMAAGAMMHHDAEGAADDMVPPPFKSCQDHCLTMNVQAILAPLPLAGAVSWQPLRLSPAAPSMAVGLSTAPDPYLPRGFSKT